MTRKNNRKGFTITELIIVIVVIAILASVMIPVFSDVIAKANLSADRQLVRNINVVLKAEAVTASEMTTTDQVRGLLAENGIEDISVKTADHVIYWVKADTAAVLYDTVNQTAVYPEEYIGVSTAGWVLLEGSAVAPPVEPDDPETPVEQDDPSITVEEASYNQQTDAVAYYMANATYNGSYSGSYFDVGQQYGANSSNLPNTYTFTLDAAMAIDNVVVTNEDNTKQYYAGAVSSEEYKVYNMIPGKTYKFIFKSGDTQKRIVKLVVTGQVRQIFTNNTPATGTGAQNIRDLGGWAVPGGSVAYGKIYRSANLDGLTQDDITMLKNYLSIGCVVDLRGTSGTSDVLGLGSNYVTLSTSATQYKEHLQSTKDVDKQVYTTIINCVLNDKPVVFHCSAGADRTGTVAFMIEALLGVAQNDLDHDYELTILSCYNTQTKVNYNPNDNTEKGYAAMVAYLKDTYGSDLQTAAFRWFHEKVGISVADLNAFKAKMTSGTTAQYQTVQLNLSNATSANTALLTTANAAYTTTVQANAGYELESVTVTMGGADITASAYNAATGEVSISQVTGPLQITAVTKVAGASYTNVAAGKYSNVSQYLGQDSLGELKAESGGIINAVTERIGGFTNKYGADGTTIRISGVAEADGRDGHTRMQIIYKDNNGADAYRTITDCFDSNNYYDVSYAGGIFTLKQKAKFEFSGGVIPEEVEIIFCFYNTNTDDLIITINEEIN